MRIIDFHTHAFPDELAPRAMQNLIDAYKTPAYTDGTIGGLRAHMKKTGVSASVVVPVATKPEQVVRINDWAASVNSNDVICFGALHPDFENIPAEIDRLLEMGIKGVKIQPDWQHRPVDDPSMMKIYEAAEGRLTVLLHVGEEIEAFGRVMSTPEGVRRVHDAFPNLTLIAAHMGGFRMWDDARKHLLATNVYFDTSFCPPQDLPDDDFRDIILSHGADKILFASDSPFGNSAEDIERLKSLGLDNTTLEKIFYLNACNLLKLTDFL